MHGLLNIKEGVM